jgi:hypothetical protein
MIRPSQLSAARHPDLATIPEPERPGRRPYTCDDYRVKVPVEASWDDDKGVDLLRAAG